MSFRFFCPLCSHDLETFDETEARCPPGCSRVGMMSNTSWYWTVSVRNGGGMTVAHAMLWDQVGHVLAWTSEGGPVPEPNMLFPGLNEDVEAWVNGLWALFSAVEVMAR